MVIIFDENYSPKLADGIRLLEQGNTKNKPIAEVWHILALAESLNLKPKSSSSYMDEEVIEIAGKKRGIIITQDNDFRRIKHLHQLYKDHKVGVIFFQTPKGKISYWDIVKVFVQNWNELKTIIQKEDTPFCFNVKSRGGISRLDF